MKITRRQLRRIIGESIELTRRDIEEYLTTRAEGYWSDRALALSGPGAIRELLQDDVMDNIPGDWSVHDFKDLIDRLSQAPYEEASGGPQPGFYADNPGEYWPGDR